MISLSFLLAALLHAPPCLALNPMGPSSALEPVTREQEHDIKAEVDNALRWVRAQQDLQSGSYGGINVSVQVLKAMATSPRAYRLSDGPYIARAVEFLANAQSADGSFGDAQASAHERLQNTRDAVFLLELFGTRPESTRRALDFLGEQGRGVQDPFASKWLNMQDDAARRALLQMRVGQLLELRSGAAHWQDGRGALLATTASVLELNALSRVLKSSSQPSAKAPQSVVGLPEFEVMLGAPLLAEANKSMLRGAEFLLQDAVAPGRWGFMGQADPGITAMAATALLGLRAPRPEAVQSAIDSAIQWLLSMQHEDGSIHAGQLPNYVTSASLMALVRADPVAHAAAIERGQAFLIRLQADEGEGYSPTDRYYGGVGYGGDERPDLSNMNMALEALADTGLEASDPTFQKALSFLQRCQNRSESNDLVLGVDGDTLISGNDGGSGYAPGDSKAGFITLRDGRKITRSYGSMTYALLKGYLFAGLGKEDGRVEAAWKWLSANYTLDVNPGFEGSTDPTAGYQGLFYYFTSMSKALDLYDQKMVTDSAGKQHDWRAEMLGRMLSLQRQDGSWINSNAPRWFEGNPTLASAYALVTLANTLPKE